MENKKNKKPLRRRLITFGLIAISVLSLGAFGITTFGNNNVVTASADVEVDEYHCTSANDYRDTKYKLLIDTDFSNSYVLLNYSASENWEIANGIAFPRTSTYQSYGSQATAGITHPNIKYFSVNLPNSHSEYYYGIGRTKNSNFQSAVDSTLFYDLVEEYDIEYELYHLGNDNILNVSQARKSLKKWSLSDTSFDETYYYFPFVLFYEKIEGFQKATGSGPYYSPYDPATCDALSMVARGNVTPFKASDEAVIRLETATPDSNLDESLDKLRSLLGYSTNENATVTVEYIEMTGVSSYEKKIETVEVDATYLGNGSYISNIVLKALGKTNADGAIDFTKFNATYTGKVFVNGVEKQLKDEIIRTAIGYDYTYDATNNTGKIAIKYSDYDYKDLYIEVKNNNIADNIVLNLGTTDAKMVGENIVLTWNISNIIKQINNTYEKPEDKQIYSLSTEEFKISFDGSEMAPEDFTLEEHGFTVTCTYTDESNKYLSTVALTFPSDSTKWENLFGLGLSTCAILVEDVELDAYLKYIEVNQDDFSYEWKEIKFANKILYSQALLFTDNLPEEYSNFISNNIGDPSSQAHSFHYCVGMQPADVYIDEGKVVFTPIYNHVTGIKVVLYNVDTKQQTVSSYKPLSTSTVSYKASYFSFNVPDGYRISNIRSYNENVSVDFNEKMPLDSTIQFYVSTAMDDIITIIADITDEWFLEVEYLAPYKDSAFSVLTTWTGTIKVSDYSVYELTQAQLETIMGVPTLNILNLATIKTVADFIPVTLEDDSTVYKIKLTYTQASMRKTNADGSYDEIMVPLTSYSAWCDIYGKEWSILWLNSPDKKIFEFENDVDREKLYGFFTMATFEQQISDLNSILSSYASDGCRTVYTSQTVKGSDIYKWFNRNKNKLGVGLISDIGIWGCELANADNVNAYSYFLYLDGTSDLNYVANNGADAYDDTDSAIDNKVEDVGDWFKDKANGIKNWFTGDSTVAKIIRIVLYVFAGLLCLLPLVWIIKKIINAIRK